MNFALCSTDISTRAFHNYVKTRCVTILGKRVVNIMQIGLQCQQMNKLQTMFAKHALPADLSNLLILLVFQNSQKLGRNGLSPISRSGSFLCRLKY